MQCLVRGMRHEMWHGVGTAWECGGREVACLPVRPMLLCDGVYPAGAQPGLLAPVPHPPALPSALT
jgi:hypothetical protein